MPKNFANTYLYSKYDEYEKRIFTFVMESTEVDKGIPEFEDIMFDVKRRQVSSSLYKVLKSDKVVLLTNTTPLPRAFKVTCMKDIRANNSTRKIFIDVSDIIKKDSTGKFVCSDIDMLISFLVSATTNMIYYIDERRITNNSKLTKEGATCFSKLLTHIVDYVAKISTNPGARTKCMYMTALYYLANIVGRDPNSDSSKNIAKQIAGISDREVDIITMQIPNTAFDNIKLFVEALSDMLKITKLTLDVILERWMWMYGVSTTFALEHFPSFATMITDAYIGAYINNQKTIEKIAGRDMVDFTKSVIEIGGSSL